MLDGPGRRLGGRRGDVHGPVPGQDRPGDAGALGRAQDGAQVARVGHAVEGHQERRGAPRPATRSSRSASGSGAASASTPWGASQRAWAANRPRPTVRDGHPVGGGQLADVVEDRARRRPRRPSTPRGPCGGRRAAARARPGGPRPGRRPGPGPDDTRPRRPGGDRAGARGVVTRVGGGVRALPRPCPGVPGPRPGAPGPPSAPGRPGPPVDSGRRRRAVRRRAAPATPPSPPDRPCRGAGHGAAATSATAKQATPSARPRAPRPSARLPLTVTGAPTAAGQALVDGLAARRQPGRLEHHGAVDVLRLPAGGPHVGHRPAQQVDRVGPGPRRVGVGEVLADVAQPGRAQQRVGDRVGDHVGVAVPGRPALARERHAAEDERTVRVVGEGVHVEALPDPDGGAPSAGTEQRLGDHQVGGPGDLEVGRASRPRRPPCHPPPRRATHRRWPRPRPACAAAQRRGPERLGRLHRHQPVAVDRRRRRGSGACRRPARPAPRRRPRRAPPRPRRRTGRRPASGRAPSCTTITSASSGTRARPARTEPDRVPAPADHGVGSRLVVVLVAGRDHQHDPAASRCPEPRPVGHTLRAASSDQSSTRRPASGSYCLAAPNRRPEPAATTTITHTDPMTAGGYPPGTWHHRPSGTAVPPHRYRSR